MLAVSALRNPKDGRKGEAESISIGGDIFLPDFSSENLLESIDFDDLFVGINAGDELPNLEMDPEILGEFSGSGVEEEVHNHVSVEMLERDSRKVEQDKESDSGMNSGGGSSLNQREEIKSNGDESVVVNANPFPKESEKERKSSALSQNPQGKRKVKVDWTPDLHRRFVQAVEQLGVDKAVPSRILELMGIDCLTRHNIASHLQKYRSHRKHLLAREAEAASWSHKRQMYGMAATRGGGGGKREMNPWLAPTMGFPPMSPLLHLRALHVWGHPSMDQSLMHFRPKHLAHSPSPSPPTWTCPPVYPPHDLSFWQSRQQTVPNSLITGTTCFPAPLAPTRFPTPPVPGIPSHALHKVETSMGVPTGPTEQPSPHPSFDFHPSKESIDAAIGDVLSKPWLPLPLGLKPPSTDSVLVELQLQGISKNTAHLWLNSSNIHSAVIQDFDKNTKEIP